MERVVIDHNRGCSKPIPTHTGDDDQHGQHAADISSLSAAHTGQ